MEMSAKKLRDEVEKNAKAQEIDQTEAAKNLVKESISLGSHLPKKAEDLVGKYGNGAAGNQVLPPL